MNPYKTITGRTLDLSTFSSTEKRALGTLTEAYDRRLDWEEFSDIWQNTLRPILSKHRPPEKRTQHPLYQIAQDLEMRLGIAQGAVAEPDYRDYLLDQIEEQFGSRYRFCKKAGIPEAFLSQVLSGKKDFSVDMLRRAAKTLNLGLALLPKADFAQPSGERKVESDLGCALGTTRRRVSSLPVPKRNFRPARGGFFR
jgi:transcriptional regulator with XRE-family HTH domain